MSMIILNNSACYRTARQGRKCNHAEYHAHPRPEHAQVLRDGRKRHDEQ